MSDTTENMEQEKTSTQTDGNTVNITQDKLNSLINEKFAKGAEKATNELLSSLGVENVDALKNIINAQREQEESNKSELEKAQETIAKLQSDLDKSINSFNQLQELNDINSLAMKNGIQDVEVFKLLYSNASKGEEFNSDSFIEGLRESKPYIFGNKQMSPRVDNSSNKGNTQSFSERVAKATTRAELDALYKEIGY